MNVAPEWLPILEHARKERTAIWENVCSVSKELQAIPEDKAKIIGDLFCDLRIDFMRAEAAVAANGSLTGIPLDPRPEDAEMGENTLLVEYFKHYFAVMDEVAQSSGLMDVDFSDPDQERVYQEAEIKLFDSGSSVNPLY